ncbi:bifunctional diguanylate cyclase/phosphodiesterase [Occallatibacter savannae]|uniref:bifunctional diguanylate cyclase/phosphodiesterase n=1 Tax=Occallatibacter savannae TaxID=1002691 RepID=UPI000D69189C|nr:bifunctional diguanylate cyclase/phosphodiesterase [Occallatibacter savannae]
MSDKPTLESRGFLEQAPVGIVHATPEGHILRCNVEFAELIGYPREEVRGLMFQEITPDEDGKQAIGSFQKLWTGATDALSLEIRLIRKDGSLTRTRFTVSLLRDREGWPSHLLAHVEGIGKATEAQAVEAAAAVHEPIKENRYRSAFETSPDGVLIARAEDGKIVDANPSFLQIMNFNLEEVVGRTSVELDMWADGEDSKKVAEALQEEEAARDLEVRLRRKKGEIFWAELSASFAEVEGEPCVISYIRDVSEAKADEEKIRSLAFYDTLTGLPNRRLLWERLRQALVSSIRSGSKHALLFVDLDGFKSLNDTLGHHIGDLLLQETARRIQNCVREVDTVARLGGDEFVIILEDLSQIPEIAAAQARTVGGKILGAIDQPFLLDGRECHTTSSMGITVFGNQNESTNEVLQQADIAMYQAKAAGRNAMFFFAPALQASVDARVALERDLRQAIRENQFSLFYQPQLDRGLLTGAEALLRWRHPSRGLIAPHEFVPLAEETGLIFPLGSWVLETACMQLAHWAERKEGEHLSIAVNVSAREFRQPKFVDHVLAALDRTGANPKKLKIELSENMFGENVEEVIAKMNKLKQHGISFSLEDFGTGYSSMTYLKRLPLDQIKIDRTFVGEILKDPISSAVAQAIISFGKAMGLSVIAEGVETEEQRAFLAKLGCHSFQGFLFSHPLPLGEFNEA